MRTKIINFLKAHPKMLNFFWKSARVFFQLFSFIFPINNKRMILSSFGGRKYDDSPKAIYDEVLSRDEFKDWDLIWAFVEPDAFEIPRGKKVKIDSPLFFKMLLTSKVWVSNSGMDRGIEINKKGIIKVETWHGTPLKKIGGEENMGSMAVKHKYYKIDHDTIRCAQSDFDLEIFERINNAAKEAFILCDLPRNDILAHGISKEEQAKIKNIISLPLDKKVLLYMPTYREYAVDENMNMYIKPPIDLPKWKEKLEKEYVLLMRAHYAVTKALDIVNDGFVFDVSNYPSVNDLYLIADVMISDYSSSFFDYSILDRPMLCFAYDLEEYSEKRGLYLDLKGVLPCSVDVTEDEVIDHILNMNEQEYIEKAKAFHKRFAPHAGNASKAVVDKIIERLEA